jgi:hypothetical protein
LFWQHFYYNLKLNFRQFNDSIVNIYLMFQNLIGYIFYDYDVEAIR